MTQGDEVEVYNLFFDFVSTRHPSRETWSSETMSKLGEFEMLVLLSILRQGSEPYANRVRADLETHAGRRVTRGALYRTLDRLADKGFLTWALAPSEVPERGGHPMRALRVTPDGLAALRRSRDVILEFLDGLDGTLDPR